jgi:RNA polymerase primary sigma factor
MSEDASLKLYLRQIDGVPLLSEMREKELARLLIRSDDPAAREELIRANLRLVVSIAKKYARRGVSMQDLVAEGNLGLLKAVEGFNPDMNVRFSTYASWWIQQTMRRALLNATRLIHIPVYMVELIARWTRAVSALEGQFGREPDLEELAVRLGISVRKARILERAVRAFRWFSEAQADEAEWLAFAEKLDDRRERLPDAIVLEEEEIRAIRALFQDMNSREAQILRLRFGLEGCQPLTLREIGERVGLTRERVRQLENEALGKLKAYLSGDLIRS